IRDSRLSSLNGGLESERRRESYVPGGHNASDQALSHGMAPHIASHIASRPHRPARPEVC
ncbi:MAG: hypothetical protein QUU85_06480, partial [Candidatus Eisenbacteria bacterium]|nr:hypothetical protein [Candidatus Eisenbacteria bacterium]